MANPIPLVERQIKAIYQVLCPFFEKRESYLLSIYFFKKLFGEQCEVVRGYINYLEHKQSEFRLFPVVAQVRDPHFDIIIARYRYHHSPYPITRTEEPTFPTKIGELNEEQVDLFHIAMSDVTTDITNFDDYVMRKMIKDKDKAEFQALLRECRQILDNL